jgi:FMN-dependent oxidoreductase (nitrilotriacetate monooxygenase family)
MADDRKRKMHLGLLFAPSGNHTASWRHPDAQADAHINIAHNLEMARTAERGKLDFIFLADNVAVRETHIESMKRSTQYIANFEPLTLLSALSVVTERIGLVSTASTSYFEPYHVARVFASLDWLSNGRAGWNIVTSAMEAEAYNFSRDAHFGHEERYLRAREFTNIVRALWDSWDDDAFLRAKESGVFFDPEKMHYLNHKGEYYSVRGPLNVPRSPQGHPVLVQAGSSDTGRGFAAEFAEVIFSAALQLSEAREYYADVKSRVAAAGRDPDHCKILPGVCYCVGRTQAEAQEQFDLLMSLVHPIAAREMAAFTLGTDLSPYALDEPVPDLPEPNGSVGTFRTAMKLARDENLTLGQLCTRLAAVRQRFFVTGTPEHIADVLEEWFTTGAADGFNLLPAYTPGGLEDFVDLVVPELQRRGLFRTEYEGRTLRENLGLPRPSSRYTMVPR